MKHPMLILILGSLFTLGALLPSCMSTPELCDRACTAWTTCTQVSGNTVNYPYDTCYEECESDGDWDIGYVNCVETYVTCPEIGNNCG